MNKETLKSIKPKNINKSDKYSANLYKYIKKHLFFNVYFDKCKHNGSNIEKQLDWNNICPSDIIIGSNIIDDVFSHDGKHIDCGQVIGKSLNSIITGRKLKETGAYCIFGGYYPKRDFIDVTEEFWKRYLRVGRCLFISHESCYLVGNEDRFTYVKNTRRCNWCGKWEHKNIIKKTTIKRLEVWG